MTTEVGTTGPLGPCGDMSLAPGEECDDGNNVDGDGCSKDCKFEYRYVFVTSGVYSGGVNGNVSFYDGKCKTLAAANLVLANRTFVAWVSTTKEHAKDRIGSSSVPYRLTDGVTVVANDTQDLLDGALAAAIQRDEKNNPVASSLVWTGTLEDGTLAPVNCVDWTLILNNTGVLGDAKMKDAKWTNSPFRGTVMDCFNQRHIYCVEKPM
jgi:cysteine-rich repeat protein